MSIDPEFQAPEAKGGRRGGGFHFVEILLIAAILAVLVALLLPATRNGGGLAAKRAQCTNNMKQILLGLHNYHDTYGTFPPPWTTDARGRRLHSWRTLLLPFVEKEALSKTIDLTRPWDDPANASAMKTIPDIYRCWSSNAPAGFTPYLAIVGPRNAFRPDGSRTLDDFVDGASITVMLVDAGPASAVPWMAPRDGDEALFLGFNESTQLDHPTGMQVGFADGFVRNIRAGVPDKIRRAILTIDGHDTVAGEAF